MALELQRLAPASTQALEVRGSCLGLALPSPWRAIALKRPSGVAGGLAPPVPSGEAGLSGVGEVATLLKKIPWAPVR